MIQIGQHFLFKVISGYNVGSSAYAIFLLFVGSGSDEDFDGPNAILEHGIMQSVPLVVHDVTHVDVNTWSIGQDF